ncbi:MAG: hypothetical protein KR126chlam2_00119 [Chlamydiae bacterium]|nr:hypothetical protein [Chlamydiota bacterium]
MFRRHKDDLPPAPPYKYGAKKGEPAEMPPRIFDNPPQPLSAPMSPPINESWNSEKAAPHFQEEEEPETTLGEGVTFNGELKFDRLLRIDGTFEGELISEGKVIVGPKGKVKANLNLKAAIIQGEVEGNITCKERVELRDEAVVTGDIQAKLLSVDEGVTIVGNVLVTPREGGS